ncbi:MAG: Ig domain protein group 2 protein, partial [Patescibacteria group bacterium]|nr:Ig domain protein group 2 protein [Patescibacteria group bacterium]
MPDYAYYKTFDADLRRDYNRVLNAFALYYFNAAKSKSAPLSANDLADVKWADGILKSAPAWILVPETRYVSKASYGTLKLPLFRSLFTPLVAPLSKFEKRYVGKFDKLFSTATINEATYRLAIDGWNRFVLHLTVYRKFGPSDASKNRAIDAIKVFDPIYKKRVRYVPASTAVTPSAVVPTASSATIP